MFIVRQNGAKKGENCSLGDKSTKLGTSIVQDILNNIRPRPQQNLASEGIKGGLFH